MTCFDRLQCNINTDNKCHNVVKLFELFPTIPYECCMHVYYDRYQFKQSNKQYQYDCSLLSAYLVY